MRKFLIAAIVSFVSAILLIGAAILIPRYMERSVEIPQYVERSVELMCFDDDDRDGYGDPDQPVENVSGHCPSGAVRNKFDCDDSNESINPGVAESCNGHDDDCDGLVDSDDLDLVDGVELFEDADLDGYGDSSRPLKACDDSEYTSKNATDCDDNDNDNHPDADEICGDEDDNDCDQKVDEAGCTEIVEG